MPDILGIGECMIQLDCDGPVSAAPYFTRQVGGDVYNTLVAVSRLGGQAGFYSRVAMDGFGPALLAHFKGSGVDISCVQQVPQGANGMYIAALLANGTHEFVYYRRHSAASQMTPAMVTPERIAQCKIVYATGITQAISVSARQTVLTAFQMAKDHGVLVAYDPNYRPSLWEHRDQALEAMVDVLPYVDVILPSAEDMQALFAFPDETHLMEYFRLRGVSIVAFKQGAQGVTLGLKGRHHFLEAYPAESVVDTIGAGDAFNGGFLTGLLHGKSLLACGQLGAFVASCSLRQRGPIAGLPTWSDVVAQLPEEVSAMPVAG